MIKPHDNTGLMSAIRGKTKLCYISLYIYDSELHVRSYQYNLVLSCQHNRSKFKSVVMIVDGVYVAFNRPSQDSKRFLVLFSYSLLFWLKDCEA